MGTIGSKQKLVTIQRRVETANSQGGVVVTWATRCTVWAHERPLTGRESLAAGQVVASLSSVWEVNYRSDISVKDRLVFGSRVLQIESVIDPTDTRQELHLTCSEGQA